MKHIRVKFIRDEDYVNYKLPCMFIGSVCCDFKCCKENGIPIDTCQNFEWIYKNKIINIAVDELVKRYLNNPLTSSVVFGGLEPFLQIGEICNFIYSLRIKSKCNDPVVIYTGYTKDEILKNYQKHYQELKSFGNVIIKYGRFIPQCDSHYDKVLGVKLASPNQYAEVL